MSHDGSFNYHVIRRMIDGDVTSGISKLYKEVRPYESPEQLMDAVGDTIFYDGSVPQDHAVRVLRIILTLLGCIRCEYEAIPSSPQGKGEGDATLPNR